MGGAKWDPLPMKPPPMPPTAPAVSTTQFQSKSLKSTFPFIIKFLIITAVMAPPPPPKRSELPMPLSCNLRNRSSGGWPFFAQK